MDDFPILQSAKLIAARELADALNLSLATIRKMTLQKRLPFLRIGRAVRFDLAEVLAYLRNSAIQ